MDNNVSYQINVQPIANGYIVTPVARRGYATADGETNYFRDLDGVMQQIGASLRDTSDLVEKLDKVANEPDF